MCIKYQFSFSFLRNNSFDIITINCNKVNYVENYAKIPKLKFYILLGHRLVLVL